MMLRTILVLAITIALGARGLIGVESQQIPPRDTRKPATGAPSAPSGTAAISGVVTNDDGTARVRFAAVLLLGVATGIVKVSATDADGRFTFAGLPADRYTVAASKPPYLGAIAGAKRPARPGTPIAVADGQKISNVAIRMHMGGSISGVVADERGRTDEPINVTLQQWRMQGGDRTLVQVPGGSARTDDRGRYRFFGLAPGEYVVSAIKGGSPATVRRLSSSDVDAALRGDPPPPPPSQPSSPPLRYAPAFYPGTTRASEAATISVGAGEERSGVDFRVDLVPTARIEGTLVTSDGQPLGNRPVIIRPGGIPQMTSTTRVRPDGTFTATNLVPGTYSLLVIGNAGQFAQGLVDVAGSDVSGVQLVMRAGTTIAGRLVFEGRGAPPSLANRYVPVQSASPVTGAEGPLMGPQSSLTDQAGAFSITNVAGGRYLIGGPISFGPSSETMTWTLTSVVIDGRDVTDLPVEISPDNPPRSVVVTYGDRHQELTGRLQLPSGGAASDYTIIAFPEDRAYWIYRSRRIVAARPGTDGRFTLSGPGPATLPAGRYLIAAVTDIGRDEQFDPAFLAQLVPASVPIALGPGEKKTQDLAIR